MFPEKLKRNIPLGGRISHFVQSSEKFTKDQEILEIVTEGIQNFLVKNNSPGQSSSE